MVKRACSISWWKNDDALSLPGGWFVCSRDISHSLLATAAIFYSR
jgi:hypothetical protein